MLYLQSVFGMAAFVVQNPKREKDWVAVQTAGIESVLRAYESMRKADSELRWKELDRLEKARKAGKLAELVKKEMAKCGDPDAMGPAPSDAI
jgi:acyl-CoA reductase-like NAD-dependent aldehyde dehydrogenase